LETGAKLGTVALREQLVWVSGPNYSADDQDSVPLILFPEGCTYRRCAIAALENHRRSWHLSFVSPSFECLKSAAVEGMGSRAGRTAVADRSPWPAIAAAADRRTGYSHGRRSNSRVVSELANYLVDSLTNARAQRSPVVLS
jgi:hypothetical protein